MRLLNYMCSCMADFLFLLYNLIVASNILKHVAVNTVYSVRGGVGLVVGFIAILAENSS